MKTQFFVHNLSQLKRLKPCRRTEQLGKPVLDDSEIPLVELISTHTTHGKAPGIIFGRFGSFLLSWVENNFLI